MDKKHFSMKSSWSWFLAGVNLFKSQPVPMILAAIVWMAIELLVAFIPAVGGMIDGLLFPALYAGFMFTANKVETGQKPTITDFFIGLTDTNKRIPLLLLGGLIVLFEMLTIAFAMTLGGLAVVILFPLGVLAFAALIYSVPLTLFTDTTPVKALMDSSQTCGQNLMAVFSLYLLLFVLLSVSVLTFGVALPIVIPLIFCMMYKSYQAIYGIENN